MSNAETDSEGSTADEYHHIVLVVDDVPRFDDEKKERVLRAIDEACDVQGYPLAAHEFADDRVELYVENPQGHLPNRVVDQLKAHSHRRYRDHPTTTDHLRWERGLHVETVNELP